MYEILQGSPAFLDGPVGKGGQAPLCTLTHTHKCGCVCMRANRAISIRAPQMGLLVPACNLASAGERLVAHGLASTATRLTAWLASVRGLRLG